MNIKKRQTVELIDLEQLPWKKINNNLSYKHLNGDIDNSEHTIILRSKPLYNKHFCLKFGIFVPFII